MFVIKNGKVLDAIHREPQYVDIRVENGKITEIGPNLIADGGDVIDAAGLTVMPGFVEAHGHIGLDGWGIGFEGTTTSTATFSRRTCAPSTAFSPATTR